MQTRPRASCCRRRTLKRTCRYATSSAASKSSTWERGAGADEGADEGVDEDADKGADEGADEDADKGADEGVDAGAVEGVDEDADKGADEGADEDADKGADEGVDAGAVEGADGRPRPLSKPVLMPRAARAIRRRRAGPVLLAAPSSAACSTRTPTSSSTLSRSVHVPLPGHRLSPLTHGLDTGAHSSWKCASRTAGTTSTSRWRPRTFWTRSLALRVCRCALGSAAQASTRAGRPR